MIELCNPPIKLEIQYGNQCCTCVNLLQQSHTKICFEEYQLSTSQIGLSPTLHSSSDNTATLTCSVHYKTWPCKDH